MNKAKKETATIARQMRRITAVFCVLAVLLLAAVLGMLLAYSNNNSRLLHNVTTASEFNQAFKENIDQKMYYYVIESQYSEGLPLDEVKSAQTLARDLLSTTTQKDSRLAITSVLDLCENLETKLYEIEATPGYDERQSQLENNVYVLTSLIEEYMYTYLYYEAAYLNDLQAQIYKDIIAETIVIALICAVLLIVLTRYITKLSNSITQPVALLCERVEEISKGDLRAHEPVQSDENEISILSEGVEQMAARLNVQITENNKKQDILRRTELALLQSQINPHFLYNTMDTITWLIEAEKTQAAIEMVSDLSTFFRLSLSKGEDIITLEDETRHVSSYLQIQKVRYKDIMGYTINIPAELSGAAVPKLTLQPLVENALYHGIKMKRGLGHIYIMGWAEGGDILLRVTDDGAGISPERLLQLQTAMQNGQRVGFGLSTVHERIRLMFGEKYGLSIGSKLGVGTTVTVRIPNKTKGEERQA